MTRERTYAVTVARTDDGRWRVSVADQGINHGASAAWERDAKGLLSALHYASTWLAAHAEARL